MTDAIVELDTTAEPHRIAAAYHRRTKHHFDRFAPHLGYMDWDTQPDPFRRFEGAAEVPLAFPDADRTPPYDDLYRPGAIKPRPVTSETIAYFFFYSMAISGWKQRERARWAVRVNPSSGNLHPTESYLLVHAVDGITERPGLLHYAPREHLLEQRTHFTETFWSNLTRGQPSGAFFVALTSIFWRESWKYGERAYRYCQHDAGHALAALRYGAALLGWQLVVLAAVNDTQLDRLLGLSREDARHENEPERPDLLAVVLPGPQPQYFAADPPDDVVFDQAEAGTWFGRANRLSPDHHPWEAIDAVEHACRTGRGWQEDLRFPVPPRRAAEDLAASIMAAPSCLSAGRILRQRRSGLEMDGVTGIPRDRFYALLARLVPNLSPVPWDAITWPVFAHLGLFVHRVEGLPPGLYALIREETQVEKLRSALADRFVWRKPAQCPDRLGFFLLQEGDFQKVAARVSCDQPLAGNGAFSLGMFVAFDRALDQYGAPIYRHLFWETGAIGQVLYLEAEAAGLRGTGIGCFFDDPVHDMFGLVDTRFQSLYHFSVGGPVEDPRLLSQPAYPHMGRAT